MSLLSAPSNRLPLDASFAWAEKRPPFARAVMVAVDEWTDARSDRLVALAEHELMHEGQVIRHMKALRRDLPASWVRA